MRPHLAKNDREAGSATVEAVVLVPVLVIFVLLSVAFGRYQTTREEVIGAARGSRGSGIDHAIASVGEVSSGDRCHAFVIRTESIMCPNRCIN